MKQTTQHPHMFHRSSAHYSLTLFLGVFLLLSASCTNDVSIDWSKAWMFSTPHYLGLSAQSLYFSDGTGGSQTLTITATGTSWEIVDLPDWVSVDHSSGSGGATVRVTCSANPSPTDARASMFTVRSANAGWDYSQTVSVSQTRCMAYATPDKTSATFDAREGSQAIVISSNVTNWTATSSQTWLSAAKSADGTSVVLTVTGNPNNVSRRAYVTIKTTDAEQQITVDQRPGNISSTLNMMSFAVGGGTQTVSITADAPWTAQTASSWIALQPSSAAAGTTEVTIYTTANNSFDSRKGYVYFIMADDNKVELPVEQEGVTFSLSTTALEFGHTAGEQTLTIATNVAWELASTLPEWVTLSAEAGQGKTDVQVTVREHTTSAQPRTATLSFRPAAINQNYDVTITQAGQKLDMEITPLQYGNKRSSQTFTFKATGSWTVTVPEAYPWLSVSPASGTGDGQVVVTAQENTGDARNGEVVLIFYENTYHVPVTQQGAFLTLSTKGLTFGSTGGTLKVDVTSNTRWTAAVKDNASWLGVNPNTGEDNDSLLITAADNPSADGREGQVLVTPADRQPIQLSISQAARYLNVNTSSLDFTAPGGTSELITVDTDGVFEITTDADWLTINKVSDKSFTVIAHDNNTAEVRNGNIKVSLVNLVSGEISQTISVTQAVHTLSLDKESISFTAVGGTSELITIDTDGAVEITTDADWLTIDRISPNAFTITASENNTAEERLGTVTISLSNVESNEISKVITVSQSIYKIGVDTEKISFSAVGGKSDIITVNADGDFTVTLSKQDSTWLSINRINNNQFSVEASENNTTEERYGLVNVIITSAQSGDDISISSTVQVSQAIHILSVDTDSLTFRSSGETSKMVTVRTDGSFTITTECEWITINHKEREKQFTLTASYNDSEEERKGEVKLSINGLVSGEITKTISLRQLPSYLYCDVEELTFSGTGGLSEKINVDASGEFEAISNSEWLSIEQVDQDGFIISALMNNTGAIRNGSVAVSLKGATSSVRKKTIQIQQESLNTLYEDFTWMPLQVTNENVAGYIWTNAQEPTEGSIANLIDNDIQTSFHSTWSVASEEYHYLAVDLGEGISFREFAFSYTRSMRNNNNRPTEIVIYGSNDKENWAKFRTLTYKTDALPTEESDDSYTSPVITVDVAYRYLKFEVTHTNNEARSGASNSLFFSLSEFSIQTKEIAPIIVESDYDGVAVNNGLFWSFYNPATKCYLNKGNRNNLQATRNEQNLRFILSPNTDGLYTIIANDYPDKEFGYTDGGLYLDALSTETTFKFVRVITQDNAQYVYLIICYAVTSNGTISKGYLATNPNNTIIDVIDTPNEYAYWQLVYDKPDSTILENGTFYIYNKKYDKFLSRGAAWGTQACLDDFGIPFIVSSPKYGITWLSALDSPDNHIGLINGTDGGTYVDQSNDGDFEVSTINGGYVFKNTDAGYLAIEDNENTKALFGLGVHGSEAAALRFSIMTANEYEEYIANRYAAEKSVAFRTAGINDLESVFWQDRTYKVQSASLTDSNEGWNWEGLLYRGGKITTNENGTEIWQGCGTLTQTVVGLKAGLYKVAINGFFRISYERAGNVNWYKNGYVMSTTYLQANGNKVRIKPIGAEATVNYDGEGIANGIYPNWMSEAKVCFDEGKYLNEVFAYVGEDGKLDISITQYSFNSDCWLTFANVSLIYYSYEGE